jgi:hypothetical protein
MQVSCSAVIKVEGGRAFGVPPLLLLLPLPRRPGLPPFLPASHRTLPPLLPLLSGRQ